jgi:hypothetical protein
MVRAALYKMGAVYNAEIVAGALLPSESRILAQLNLDGVSAEELQRQITTENILQKRSLATAIRMARLIHNRFQYADDELLKIVVSGTRTMSNQALLVMAIRHSRLLGDFLLRVVKEHWRQFQTKLKPTDWDEFLAQCEQLDPSVKNWQLSTRVKLDRVVRKCLVEAGYLESSRNPIIIPVHLAPEIRAYLLRPGNEYVLSAMDVTL